MKKFNSFGKYALVALSLATFNYACTDLDEDLYSQISADEYQTILKNYTDAQYADAFLAAYAPLTAFGGHNGINSDQECSTDEVIIPQRGGDWFDGGQWIRMHRHEYTPNEESLNNAWKSCYSGIATCNRLIKELPVARPNNATTTVAELRALRAYYYQILLDMFGNVPLIVTFPGDLAEATAKSRAEVFAFVETEYTQALPSVADAGAATYGRMSKGAVNAALARLYTNAQVYTGTAQWDKAIAAADAVINSGKYAIETNYYANFGATNNNSRENIFVVPFDAAKLQGFNLAQMTLHYESKATFNLTDQPWNGYCTSADFYNSYDATDARRANLLAGPQFAADGTTRLQDNGAESNDPDGKPLTFTPALNEHFPNCLRQAGARVGKYKFENGATPNLNNDFPLLRYADVLLMKAEALWRKNATDAVALGLFNQVRARAGAAAWTAGDMTSAKILAERGRETFFEGIRRTDMIRFGRYFEAGYTPFKPGADQACKGLFPIPQPQIDANKNLKQNPCY
jgi:starch-binding outer membrane protein, SusD/RagB family